MKDPLITERFTGVQWRTHDRTNCNKLKPFFRDYIHMLPQIYFKTEWEVKPK